MLAVRSLITSSVQQYMTEKPLMELRNLAKQELIRKSGRFFECAYPCKDPECPAVSDVGHQHYELSFVSAGEQMDARFVTVAYHITDGKESAEDMAKRLKDSYETDVERGYLVPLREV